mgnify:CR=1 FL=1
MRRIIILFFSLAALSVSEQETDFLNVLESVEQNNKALEARRKLTSAQTLEARTGNSLQDPEVEYEHAWGKPSSLGQTGELSVSQGFDFPTVYAQRSKLAKIREQQYGHE